MTAKENMIKVLDSLPDDASIDQILHAIYISLKFRKGEQEIAEGKGVTQEDAERRLAKWQY